MVVAEGARLPDGHLVTSGQPDGPAAGQVRLGGIGDIVARELEHRLNREVRCVVLGHLQRGGPPTNFDRCLATMYGAHAVRLLIQQKFGMMVSYQPPMIRAVPIKEAVGKLAQVTADHSGVEAARALGISFGDLSPRETVDALGWRETPPIDPLE